MIFQPANQKHMAAIPRHTPRISLICNIIDHAFPNTSPSISIAPLRNWISSPLSRSIRPTTKYIRTDVPRLFEHQTIHQRATATMAAPAPIESTPLTLLRPLLLLSYSASYIPLTIWNLLKTFDLQPLTNISDFKDVWFARFWTWFGTRAAQNAGPKVIPIIQNNATGTLLDIGPGNGQWLFLFAQGMNPSITKIYGVEPNKGLHAELRANAVKAGLGDVYEIVGCGAEEAGSKGGIQEGSVDTIVTVQCLCSIPGPERVIRDLYPLLKPGGKWLVYEHVRTKYQQEFVGGWQREFVLIGTLRRSDNCADLCCVLGFINLAWPHFFNGCDICRPTDEWLLQAGEWDEVDLRPGVGEGKYDTIPHVIGSLTKRR